MSEKEIRGKYNLELNFPGDGRVFLNYWDWMHGRDVCVEIKDREILRDDKPVDFFEVFDAVCETLKAQSSNPFNT